MQASEAAAEVQVLFEQCLAREELVAPSLPDVAIQVVRTGTKDCTNAEQLSAIIDGDRSLSRVVRRIAASAANRPAVPITSLQHAVSWLGLNEVTNIAFTLALQGRLLHVPGQQGKARRLWRHALASALWSRQLAMLLGVETGPSYLSGLLHDIGRIVTLDTLHDLALRTGSQLTAEDYDRLIEFFHRDVGLRVIEAWELPASVLTVATLWHDYASAGCARFACNIVNVAHGLADYSLHSPTDEARDLVVTAAAYRDLGPNLERDGSLFESAADINAELDRYLCP